MSTKIVNLLKSGQIGVMPTDTIYGLVGLAQNPETVAKIYQLRKRTPSKPCIILIASLDDLQKFEVQLSKKQLQFLYKNWPNPLSVILPVKGTKFEYLHRGKKTLAFRMPKDDKLLEILKAVGPLIAPSANIEGKTAAQTIKQAREYFADQVSFYLDGRFVKSQPSTLIELFADGTFRTKREGGWKL